MHCGSPRGIERRKGRVEKCFTIIANRVSHLSQFKSPPKLLALDSYHYLFVIDITRVVLPTVRWLYEEEPFVWK